MYTAIIIVFAIGYLGIALEHRIKINKTAVALLLGVLCWALLIFGSHTIFPNLDAPAAYQFLSAELLMHVGEISEIIFFLLGAMAIVELMDTHGGFSIITGKIKLTKKVYLLWILTFITFFLSALLDNLTTSIVMAAVLKKMIKDKNDLWLFASMIIIAANAGGAWSPIGDVTTIMLWIGGQVTAINIITHIFIPSLIASVVPLLIFSFIIKGDTEPIELEGSSSEAINISPFERYLVFYTGFGVLLFVPVFKTLTHLPPFMGVLFGLSIVWILTELLHKNKIEKHRSWLCISGVLQRVDTASVLFFLGILIAVAALQTSGHLAQLSGILDSRFQSIYAINIFVGLLSSIIDNVPIVAAVMGMYPMETYAVDHPFWQLLAYCAGTGGSILIIGSAAGIAIMGIFKIDFIWYLKRVSVVAFLGYLSGVGAYFLLNYL